MAKDKHEPIRFLGTWLTASGSKTYQRNIIKNKVYQITQTLSHKQITDKQCRYILNHVLLPSIEYLLQDMVLTDQECIKINSMILKTFKHKIKLPQTAINSAMHMHTGYKIFHIHVYDRQLKLHTQSWLNHINSNNINKPSKSKMT